MTGAVRVKAPLVPVTVSGNVPAGVSAVVATVSVDAPDPPLMLTGAKEAVAPAGSPVTLNATLPLNPLIGAVAMAAVVPAPAVTVRVAGVAVSPKSAAAAAAASAAACSVTLPVVPDLRERHGQRLAGARCPIRQRVASPAVPVAFISDVSVKSGAD